MLNKELIVVNSISMKMLPHLNYSYPPSILINLTMDPMNEKIITMNMPEMFPVEVWVKILENVDQSSILKLRQLCSTMKRIVDNNISLNITLNEGKRNFGQFLELLKSLRVGGLKMQLLSNIEYTSFLKFNLLKSLKVDGPVHSSVLNHILTNGIIIQHFEFDFNAVLLQENYLVRDLQNIPLLKSIKLYLNDIRGSSLLNRSELETKKLILAQKASPCFENLLSNTPKFNLSKLYIKFDGIFELSSIQTLLQTTISKFIIMQSNTLQYIEMKLHPKLPIRRLIEMDSTPSEFPNMKQLKSIRYEIPDDGMNYMIRLMFTNYNNTNKMIEWDCTWLEPFDLTSKEDEQTALEIMNQVLIKNQSSLKKIMLHGVNLNATIIFGQPESNRQHLIFHSLQTFVLRGRYEIDYFIRQSEGLRYLQDLLLLRTIDLCGFQVDLAVLTVLLTSCVSLEEFSCHALQFTILNGQFSPLLVDQLVQLPKMKLVQINSSCLQFPLQSSQWNTLRCNRNIEFKSQRHLVIVIYRQ